MNYASARPVGSQEADAEAPEIEPLIEGRSSGSFGEENFADLQ